MSIWSTDGDRSFRLMNVESYRYHGTGDNSNAILQQGKPVIVDVDVTMFLPFTAWSQGGGIGIPVRQQERSQIAAMSFGSHPELISTKAGLSLVSSHQTPSSSAPSGKALISSSSHVL